MAGIFEAVGVDVVEGEASGVLIDEGEGGAGDGVEVGGLEAEGDAFDEMGFAGAEFADEADDFAAVEGAA